MFKLNLSSTLKKVRSAFVIITFIGLAAACKKNSPTDPALIPGAVPYVQGSGVYVSGTASVGDSTGAAAVWHNGAVSALSSVANTYSSAHVITAQGNDVYIAGLLGKNVVYWKNGVMSAPLNTPAFLTLAVTGIAVQGNDVYICGKIATSTGYLKPVYWKNGVLNYLSYDPKYTFGWGAYGIAIAGSDVYINGTRFYWKNGQYYPIPDNVYYQAMTASGTDIYFAGSLPDPTVLVGGMIAYWKNGIYNFVSKINMTVTAMTVHGTDVYLAGYYYPNGTDQQGIYFKNGVLTSLPLTSGNTGSTVNSIYVDSNNNVYLSGSVTDSNGKPYPAYWKNGSLTVLGAAYSITSGIVYVP